MTFSEDIVSGLDINGEESAAETDDKATATVSSP
jgi:hypothetical protein